MHYPVSCRLAKKKYPLFPCLGTRGKEKTQSGPTYAVQSSVSRRQHHHLDRSIYARVDLAREFLRNLDLRDAKSRVRAGLVEQRDHGHIVRVRILVLVDRVPEDDVDRHQVEGVDGNEREGTAGRRPGTSVRCRRDACGCN